MYFSKTFLGLTILAITPASAISLAFTDFNGRTIGGTNNSTASNLNWITDGLNDPGSMTALNAGGANQAIFDSNPLVQNIFAPGLNTGNGNTFWTTDIDITVASGFDVTLTDVTFNYFALGGRQTQNPYRDAGFVLTLLDPTAAAVPGGSISGSVGPGTGAGDPVTLTFTAPVALTDPGTYTLRIAGGDTAGINATGNHTAIDNLSINGTAVASSVIPEPSSLLLSTLGALGLVLRRKRSA
ncbi:MAG: PEP-CTERM sorting domain-containing protein [Akkermansiaceae bacterium]